MASNFWEENAEQWTRVVDSMSIASRQVTNPGIVDVIRESNLTSVLDVGCGEGWLGRALPQNIQYMGIDGSSRLIEEARARSNHHFEVVSYLDIELGRWQAKKLVDAVVFNFSLMSQDLESTLIHSQNFLSPDGKIIIQTVHPCFKLPKYEDGWFKEEFKAAPVAFKNEMPWYGRTLSSWIDLFGKCGLQVHRLIEPRKTELPTSIIYILKRSAKRKS